MSTMSSSPRPEPSGEPAPVPGGAARPRTRGVRLGRVAGVELVLDRSWFVIAALTVVMYGLSLIHI